MTTNTSLCGYMFHSHIQCVLIFWLCRSAQGGVFQWPVPSLWQWQGCPASPRAPAEFPASPPQWTVSWNEQPLSSLPLFLHRWEQQLLMPFTLQKRSSQKQDKKAVKWGKCSLKLKTRMEDKYLYIIISKAHSYLKSSATTLKRSTFVWTQRNSDFDIAVLFFVLYYNFANSTFKHLVIQNQ